MARRTHEVPLPVPAERDGRPPVSHLLEAGGDGHRTPSDRERSIGGDLYPTAPHGGDPHLQARSRLDGETPGENRGRIARHDFSREKTRTKGIWRHQAALLNIPSLQAL